MRDGLSLRGSIQASPTPKGDASGPSIAPAPTIFKLNPRRGWRKYIGRAVLAKPSHFSRHRLFSGFGRPVVFGNGSRSVGDLLSRKNPAEVRP